MSKITIVIAGDANFKKYVEQGVRWNTKLDYPSLVYDLGNLGFGKVFEGKVGNNTGAKIPCKPAIIYDALCQIGDNEFLVWLDADALIFEKIDEIVDDYDIGVTVRIPKDIENSLPINAGIVFFRKSQKVLEFVNTWKNLSESGPSDQPPLNALCQVTSKDRGQTVLRGDLKIRVYPCEIYNNMYKKNHENAKIKHYKSKRRHLYPLEELS